MGGGGVVECVGCEFIKKVFICVEKCGVTSIAPYPYHAEQAYYLCTGVSQPTNN